MREMSRLSSSSIGFRNKDWGSEKKKAARSQSIFGVYRQVMERESLPDDKQYWTLAGKHTSPGCELPHAISDGLIHSHDQFHGVDYEADVVRHNRKSYPEAHWHKDEFTCALEKAKSFNPGLINFDMVCMVDNACLGIAQALHILVEREVSGVMMAANFLLNNPREVSAMCHSPLDVWEWFYRSASQGNTLRRAMNRGWEVHTKAYLYDGADKVSRSYMETVYFFRKEESGESIIRKQGE